MTIRRMTVTMIDMIGSCLAKKCVTASHINPKDRAAKAVQKSVVLKAS
jgi:hypothetical protein